MPLYTYILVLFIITLATNIAYWLVIFSRMDEKKSNLASDHHSGPLAFVSIIVVFKNEASRLQGLIDQLLRQDYPNFELILMNDFSSDNFKKIIDPFLDLGKVGLMNSTEDRPGKKVALHQAITQSKGEFILVTDADCQPVSDQWIRSMVSKATSTQASMVLGYGPYRKYAGWVNLFVRFETVMTAIQYLSYAVIGMPYMGVGRNLLYQRALFLAKANQTKGQHIASGDDDLFVNAVGDQVNTSISLDPDSYVISEPKTSLVDFIQQKRRHVGTSAYYRWYHQLLLGIYAMTQIGIYVMAIIIGVTGGWWVIGWLIFQWFIKMIVFKSCLNRLGDRDLLVFFPVLDILQAFYYLLMATMLFVPKKKW